MELVGQLSNPSDRVRRLLGTFRRGGLSREALEEVDRLRV
jgi:hypothetical protein